MKTFNDLMEILSDELDAVRGDNPDFKRSREVRGHVSTIFAGQRLQMEYARMSGSRPTLPLLDTPTVPAPRRGRTAAN